MLLGDDGGQVLLLGIAAVRDAPKEDEDDHDRGHDRKRDPNAVDGPLRGVAPLLHDDGEHVGDDRAICEAVHDRERLQHARARCPTKKKYQVRKKKVIIRSILGVSRKKLFQNELVSSRKKPMHATFVLHEVRLT